MYTRKFFSEYPCPLTVISLICPLAAVDNPWQTSANDPISRDQLRHAACVLGVAWEEWRISKCGDHCVKSVLLETLEKDCSYPYT